MSTLATTDIQSAAEAFIKERDTAMTGIASTAKAAIRYGELLGKARETMTGKEFDAWIIELVPSLPLHESTACMKVAAKYAQQGKQLFIERTSAAWAQAELGLLPPGNAQREAAPDTPWTPADALAAIEKLKRRLAEVFADVPLSGWDEAEQTLLHTALGELDLIGGDK